MMPLPSRAYVSSYSLSMASRLTPVGRIVRAAEAGDWRSALSALSDRPIAAFISQSQDPEVAVDEFVSRELQEASRIIISVSGTVPAVCLAQAYADFVNFSSLLNGSRTYLSFGIMEDEVLAGELVGKRREEVARILHLHGIEDFAGVMVSENPRLSLVELSLRRMKKWAKGARLSEILGIIVDHWNFALLMSGSGRFLPGGHVPPEDMASGKGPEVIVESGYPLLARALRRPEFSGLILDVSLSVSVWRVFSGDLVVDDVFMGAFFSLLAERSLYRHLYFALEVYKRARELADILRGLP